MKHYKKQVYEPVLSDDYFDFKQTKSAIWQYLVDHATPTFNNTLKIFIRLPNDEKEFWRHIGARKKGFERKDYYQIVKSAMKKEILYKELNEEKEARQKQAEKLQHIKLHGSLMQRIKLKIASYLISRAKNIRENLLA